MFRVTTMICFYFFSDSVLFALDYVDLYHASDRSVYNNSNVSIDGEFSRFSCVDKNKERNSYCLVSVDVKENGRYLSGIVVKVGNINRSSLKRYSRGDRIDFDCTYKGNVYRFEGCR